MNLLLFDSSERSADDKIVVHGSRRDHLVNVQGVQVGYTLRVGEINGKLGQGVVQAIARDHVELRVELHEKSPAPLPVTLILALPRPKMLRRILRTSAEFGVAELHLINSYRVQKSYWQTPVLDAQRYRDYLLDGLAQSCHTRLPQLLCHPRFKPFVEDELVPLIAGQLALLAHPAATRPFDQGDTQAQVIVIGPEGGFTDYEVGLLSAAGCRPVSLGPRILRVENAVTAVLSRFL